MEYALFLSEIKELENVNKKYTRIYFGEELCEYRFPDRQSILEMFVSCRKEGLDFTLVTCVFTDAKLEEVKLLFEQLETYKIEIEAVVNDVGVLYHILSRKYEYIKVIIGRMLNKSSKTPRYLNIKNQLNKYQKEALSYSLFMNWISSSFFQNCKAVIAYELDNTYQFDIPKEYSQLEYHLILPYILVSVTRNCVFNGCESNNPLSRKRERCHHECKRYSIKMQHAILFNELECISAGVFYKNSVVTKSKLIGISRIIVNEKQYKIT